jgi:hypothetical protein
VRTYHEEGTTRVHSLGCRVDWLTIAFAVLIAPSDVDELRTVASTARTKGSGEAEVTIGSLRASLRRKRRGDLSDRWVFQTGDVRGLVDLTAREHNVEVTASASFLATHTIDEAVQLLVDVARSFGKVSDCRVRRLDLAADFAGFPLRPELVERWMIPRRGKIGNYQPRREEGDDDTQESPPRRTFLDAVGRVLGFTICAGGTCMARVYDKTAELEVRRLAGYVDKEAIEHARWSSFVDWREWHAPMVAPEPAWRPLDEHDRDDHGKHACESCKSARRVTRVEFQLRGEALDDLDLRSPFAVCGCGRRDKRIKVETQRCPGGARCHSPHAIPLASRVDELWQYLTTKWLRLLSRERRILENGKLERADRVGDDPAWADVQGVAFTHLYAPAATRIRRRGGASFEQALGAMLSTLAGTRQLQRINLPPAPSSDVRADDDAREGSHDPQLRAGSLQLLVARPRRQRLQRSRMVGARSRAARSAVAPPIVRRAGPLPRVELDELRGRRPARADRRRRRRRHLDE